MKKIRTSVLLTVAILLPFSAAVAAVATQFQGGETSNTVANPDLTASEAKQAAASLERVVPSTTPMRKGTDSQRPAVTPVKEMARPSIEIATNDNQTTSVLGQLCWYRREMVLALVDQMSLSFGITPANPRQSNDVARQISAWQEFSKLPDEILPFAERLRSDAKKVIADKGLLSNESIASAFEFESYPGVKEYLDMATREPGCRQP